MATLDLGPIPGTSGLTLDRVNAALRASPAWQDFMRARGQTGPRVHLSDAERRQFELRLAQAGVPLPKGMNIDPAGNINEANQGVFQNRWVQAGLITAAALATAGAAGFGPLAGVLGSGGGGAAAGGAAAGTAGAAGTGVSTAGLFAPTGLVGTGAGAAGAGAAGGGVGLGALYGGATAAAPSLTRTLLGYGAQYGLPVAGSLIGANMANNASREAAEIQNQYLQRALDAALEDQQYQRGVAEEARTYTRGQRADYLGRLDPFRTTGTEALGRASALLTTSSYRPELGRAGGGGTSGGGAAGGALVRMQAPDGSTQEVPPHLVDYYASKGARQV